jgi:hypothetical protein
MLLRKRQLLRKVELTEGTAVALSTADYVQALDPTTSTPQDIEDRVVSGASLSEEVGVPGRTSFSHSYGLDVYSLGELIQPLMDPDMRACGLRGTAMVYLSVSIAPTGPTWAGQTLDDGLGGTATLAIPVGSSGRVYYRGAAGGFPGDTTIATPTSGTITLTSTTPVVGGFQYTPDSTPTALITLTSGVWGGTGTPPVLGELVTNGVSGDQAARGVVVATSGTQLEVQPILPHPFENGDTVTGLTGGGTNTVAVAGQVLLRVPSLTIQDNIDGWYRRGTGCRGNMTLALEAGKVGRLNIEMQGQLSAHGDTPLLTGVSTVSPSLLPRWQSAVSNIDGLEIPRSRWSLNLGNQVALLTDAHGANGVRGSSITARQPTLDIDPDHVPAAVLNYLSRMTTANTSSFFTMWGSSVSLRVAVHVPRGQIYNREDLDKDGFLASGLQVRPKRATADGDNEVYFMFGV